MFKLIKYELIGRYKLIVGCFSIIALLNIVMVVGFNFWWQGGMEAAFVISLLLGFLGMFVVAVDSINIVRKDLYNDSGYLLFSLPQSGYSIMGAKFIVGIMEIVMFAVFQLLISFIFIAPMIKSEFWNLVNGLIQVFPDIVFILILIFWGLITLFLMISFSLVLSKSILNTKKFGNLASFGVFIAVAVVTGLIQKQLTRIPWTAEFNLPFTNIGNLELSAVSNIINIPEMIFSIVLPVIFFVLAGFLIENKLEMR